VTTQLHLIIIIIVSVGTYRHICHAEGHEKRDTVCKGDLPMADSLLLKIEKTDWCSYKSCIYSEQISDIGNKSAQV